MVAAVKVLREPAESAGLPPDEKVNVLIVDDLPEKHVVIASVLEELGQNIVSARSGREALRLLLQMEFAVILLDVNMPDIDGLETASLIRQYKKTAQTPILFITSYVDELQAARGYALGAVDYISSPVIPDILRSKVRVFVELYRMHRQMQHQAAAREALARSESARIAAEEAIRRADYLSVVSQKLALSLDIDATTHALVDLAVPALGLGAAVVLLDIHGELVCRIVKTADMSGGAGATLVKNRRKLNSALAKAIHSSLMTRSVAFSAPLPIWESERAAVKDARITWLQGTQKMVVCPLFAGDQLLGALLLFGNEDNFTSADVALITEVVSRASIAMENARLYTLVQEADRRKNEFLAMLAHELRNPLAPIRNAVHIIHGVEEVSDTVAWARDVIGRQVDHMSRMVDDLLDVSRIVRGKVTVQTETMTLASLFERAVEASTPFIVQKNQELKVSLPEHTVVMQGDLVRLSQVLSNLLNNASKFTQTEGTIALSATLKDDVIAIDVVDNGQGIEPEFLPHIFDLFVQGDQSLDRSQGGLGIGLTLVKHLVDLHRGRVEAHSTGKGKGTRISLYFPAKALASEDFCVSPPVDSPRPVAAGSRKVLVVDDLSASAETLKVLLEMEGYEVRVAFEGAMALKLAQEFSPDVVILDIGLPGMDGFEVARQLRKMPESQHALLIALTGYGEAESRLRSQEAGFDYHVVKPADIDFLLSIVSRSPVDA